MSSPERWEAVKSLFGDVLDASTDERARLLASAAESDQSVADEVAALLSAYRDAGSRFDQPAVASLATDGDAAFGGPSLVGKRVGAFQVVRRVGDGGMGSVYEAVRVDDVRQRVAIKTIAFGADSASIVGRFQYERRILADLQHPNIAALYDAGVTDDGTPYFAMEFVDGEPIDEWCATKRLTIEQRLDLFRQVCGAVQYAHRRLVVHRDLKPANILVSRDGVVKLLDFGIAKITGGDDDAAARQRTLTGLTPLTLAYASPEQARGEPAATASDIYSLGVVLYQLVTGRLPVQTAGKSPAQLLAAVTEEPTPPPSVACTDAVAVACGLGERSRLARILAGELDAIVLMALRKEASRRYASADALAEDLHRYVRGLPVSARPDTLRYRVRKFARRRRALVLMAAGLAATVVVGAGVTWAESRVAAREAARSQRIASFLLSVLGAGDVTNVGGMTRIGPRASVKDLLDSALTRVPTEFSDDPAIRSRLYTSIGASYLTQSRLQEAAAVLDSAVSLSRLAYGDRSTEYALACIEAAETANHRDEQAASLRYTKAAQAAIGDPRGESAELLARTYASLATIALIEGDYPRLDSLARRALAIEEERTKRPSLVKAVALNRLGGWAALQNQMPRADTFFSRALGMLDSLHATFNLERIDVLNNLTTVSIGLGRMDRADSLARLGLGQAVSIFGPDSREAALLGGTTGLIALIRKDTATAHARLLRAAQLIDSIPDVVSAVRFDIHAELQVYWAAMGRFAEADSVAKQMLADTRGRTKGAAVIIGHLEYGIGRAMLRDFVPAEAHIRQAVSAYQASSVQMPTLQNRILYSMAAVVARQGKDEEAARWYALLPPAQAAGVKGFVAANRAADQASIRQRAARQR